MNDYLIKNVDKIINNHEPEIIKTEKGNVVVLSEEDYNNITTHPYNKLTISTIEEGRKTVSDGTSKTFNNFDEFLKDLKSDDEDNI